VGVLKVHQQIADVIGSLNQKDQRITYVIEWLSGG